MWHDVSAMTGHPATAAAVTPKDADAVVIAASRTDPGAFALIYDRYAASLYRYAYRRVGRHIAEDVVAETFLAAFRGRERYDTGRPDARPWLFAIVTKELARHHRAEQARYRALARTGPEPVQDVLAERVATYVSAAAARGPLSEALASLAGRDRDVLLLIAWGDLSYEEVAQTLSIPLGTVRSRLNRARRKLRERLDANHTDIEGEE
jgi:RNA polymerase sigma-70 factor (ECF subfamily)